MTSSSLHNSRYGLSLFVVGLTATATFLTPVQAQTPAPASTPAAPALPPALPDATTTSTVTAPALVPPIPGTGLVPTLPGTALGATIPAQTLTLDEVLSRTLDRNSTVQLAQIRVKKADELITQTVAQAYPQIRIDVTDTQSSQRSFGTGSGGSSAVGSLPGGGQIPVIVDQGGGTTGTFVGGGGGGNGPSTGSVTSTGGGGTVSVGGASSSGTVNGTTSTGTGNTGTTGTTTGATGVTGHALPLVVESFAQSFQNTMTTADQNAAAAKATKAHDTTTTGTGTGTTTGFTSTTGGQYNNYGARLSVTQSIDLFNLVPTSRDVLTISRDFYVIDLQRVENEIALSTKSAFFDVLRAQASVAVQQEQVTAAAESLRIAQARFAAGAAAQFDVVTAQTTLSNAQQLLDAAQNQVALSQANLNSILGQDLDTPIALETPPLPPAGSTIDLSKAVQTAYVKRPELMQATNNITIAKKLIKLAGVGLLPSLSLTGSAGYAGAASQNNSKDTYSVSANLGIPLYDGGTTHSRVRSAQDDLQTQEVTLQQLRENVSLEVRQAYLNVVNAQQRSAAAQQGVTQAVEALRLANLRYQNERGTLLDISNAQAQLATARNNLASAQFDYQTSLAQLTRAEGGR